MAYLEAPPPRRWGRGSLSLSHLALAKEQQLTDFCQETIIVVPLTNEVGLCMECITGTKKEGRER
jgi:hypothetical protein